MHALIIIAALSLDVHCDWDTPQGLSIVSYESTSGATTPNLPLSLPPPVNPTPYSEPAAVPPQAKPWEQYYRPYHGTDGRWWWRTPTADYWSTSKPVAGRSYAGWTLQPDGTMQRGGSQMAVQIQPAKAGGHWETKCYGNYCRQVWVND